jgi:hypothetical protein
VCVDIECLVNQIKSVLFRVVTKDVLLLATTSQFHHATSDKIIDVAIFVNEQKAFVADPLA